MNFLLLCAEFFKTGLFAVGGGLATVPFLKEISLHYGWYSLDQLSTMIAVSESTPGPIGVNMATYVGFHLYGLPGAIATTLSLVAPSIIVIILVAQALKKFQSSPIVQGIFMGIRPAVVGFIMAAVASIYVLAFFKPVTGFSWKSLVVFIALMAFYQWKKQWHPVILIGLSAVIGIGFAL